MTGHLNASDREALRLAHELREELRQTLRPGATSDTPAVSPYVDAAGRPSALVRMDADSARVLMMMLSEYRAVLAGRHQAVGAPAHEFEPRHDPMPAPYPVGAPGQPLAPMYP
ncbi:hypothetical protein DPM19_03845 [Actinomadura craniellae]|uniref:Uncharacterized protein n=1 Tax=Actinomadura craniellae TaxID=2231787 RepID=A0A365HAX1_9ACTN|nr:hypothetical protein [Actinomadura craniellae]RAY16076.1 hypothetical protein DPM19_03845 [Actinomadura craniellae]